MAWADALTEPGALHGGREMSLRGASEPGNLLTRLYRLAHRQQGSFVTESFTQVLHHLCHEHPDVGAGVIEWLAGDGFLQGAAGSEPLRIRTQLVTDGFGIPEGDRDPPSTAARSWQPP